MEMTQVLHTHARLTALFRDYPGEMTTEGIWTGTGTER